MNLSSEFFQTLSREPLSDGIYNSLYKAILSGSLPPGEHVPELELSRTFNTSQGPVREALKRLEQEGLVNRIPHKGTFVSRITREEVLEVYALRTLIESIALKRFIFRANEEDIRKLQGFVDTMRQAASETDVSTLVEQDMSFHRYICSGSGSKILFQIWSIIHGKARLASAAADRFHRINLNEIAELHQPLLNSIFSRESERALHLIKMHIHYLWDRIPQEFWDSIPKENQTDPEAKRAEYYEWSGDWSLEAVMADICGANLRSEEPKKRKR